MQSKSWVTVHRGGENHSNHEPPDVPELPEAYRDSRGAEREFEYHLTGKRIS
jgi:hypothetical protein